MSRDGFQSYSSSGTSLNFDGLIPNLIKTSHISGMGISEGVRFFAALYTTCFAELFLSLYNFNTFSKLSYCLLMIGLRVRMYNASLIANLWLSDALVMMVVFSVNCALDGFELWHSLK